MSPEGITIDRGGQIGHLLITPVSRFSSSSEDAITFERFINLTIITQNQGLIAMPTQNSSVISMTYSGDLQSNNDQSIAALNNVYMQEIVDGYNLSYTYTCSYQNETGGA